MSDDFHAELYEYARKLNREYWNFAAEYGAVMTAESYIRSRVMNELEHAIREVTGKEDDNE